MKINETIIHEPSGEALTLLVKGEDNNGASSKYEMCLPAHDKGPYVHYHTSFKEIFTVQSGVLDFYLGKEQVLTRLHAGQSMTAEIGHLHSFRNNTNEPVTFSVVGIPAGGFVEAFQVLCGIANNGGADKDGYPASLLEKLYFVKLTKGYRRGMPLLIQKGMFALATWALRLSGRKKRLDGYISKE